MKVYVKKGCIDSNRDAHEVGAVIELDKKTDAKLWTLKLVEDYDVKKHGLPKGNKAELQTAKSEIVKLKAEIKSLKDDNGGDEKLKAANEKIAELEKANAVLNGFVEEAIKLPKGQKPNGYVKA